MPVNNPSLRNAQHIVAQRNQIAAQRLLANHSAAPAHGGPYVPPGGQFTQPPPPLNGTGLPDTGGYSPGQMLPGGGNPGSVQQPVIDPAGLSGTGIYTDPVSGLQYQNQNGQWNEISGYLADPSNGHGTYNGLPQGVQSLAPGQAGYSAPGTPQNQVPGYFQADAQGGYITGDWNAYTNYAQGRGVTPFAGPGSTYGGNPQTDSGLQQAMLNAAQAGNNSNPNIPNIPNNVPQPQTPQAPQIPTTVATNPTPSPVVDNTQLTNPMAPTSAPSPQQEGNRNIPGFAAITPEGGTQSNMMSRFIPKPSQIVKPVVKPMGSGFGGAAGRLMGRL